MKIFRVNFNVLELSIDVSTIVLFITGNNLVIFLYANLKIKLWNLKCREEPHVITKRATGDFFDVISSALSSLMNYVYRIFLQPWIAVIETLDSSGSSADNSSTMDKSFYTVEGRSAIDPSSKPVKWREVGTAIFEVISKLTWSSIILLCMVS